MQGLKILWRGLFEKFILLFTSLIIIQMFEYNSVLAWNNITYQKITTNQSWRLSNLSFSPKPNMPTGACRKLGNLGLFLQSVWFISILNAWEIAVWIRPGRVTIKNDNQIWQSSGNLFQNIFGKVKELSKNWTRPENCYIYFSYFLIANAKHLFVEEKLENMLLPPIIEMFLIFCNFLRVKVWGY